MTLLLALLYPIAIQYERGGWWKLLAPVTFIAALLDVLANYSELALLMWDWPQKGEYLFSKRLERLIHNDDWRGSVARLMAIPLNYFDPTGKHIE